MRFAANPRPRTGTRQGYALLTTLLVLSLILMVVVALLGLQRRNAGRVGLDRDTAEARANAIYALETALGELQRYAGPDQAVTAPANILEEEDTPIANPKWTGVWHATEEGRANDSPGVFLVSGNERFEITDDLTAPPEGYLVPEDRLDPASPKVVELVPDSEEGSNDRVVVPLQSIHQPGETASSGHYAYWVGDEGIKAKVNLLDAHRAPEDDQEKMHRLTVAQRNGMESLFPEYDPEDERLEALTTLDEFALIQEQEIDLAPYFHDLTTYSKGLLTDTRRGGLRRDLTTAFESDKIFQREFGADKTGITPGSSVKTNDLYTLDTKRLEEFYLVPEILSTARSYSSNGGQWPWAGGPNWGNLREHYLLYQSSPANFPFLPHPRCAVKMRHYSFNPFKHGVRNAKRDYYHRNSPVCPILSRAQLNVRLRTRLIPPKNENEEEKYEIDLEIQPVVGLWNPHNIPFSPRIYRFDWEISTFLVLQINGIEKRYDLYRLWKGSSSPWFSLNSQNVDLQPGEMRMFAVDSRKELRQNVTLVPRWSEDGCFWITLPENPRDRNGDPLVVDRETLIEVREVGLVAATENENWSTELKELQKHNTFMAIKYGEVAGNATSSVEDSSVRMNNLWKADDESGPQIVPQPGDAIPPFRASQHTAEPKHLAAWSYYLRTTQEDDLGHRNFIDSNVRAIVANSRWDGSVEDRGWRAMGWLNDGINRALLPPGNEEPEADGLLRYRGFGGDSIGGTGQTHLILFDVPREPLVSVGQLQHANLGRYNNEPSFIVGNSYHNIRIPLEATVVRDFADHDDNGIGYDTKNLDVFDLSWFVNHQLWDSWYFSTVLPDDAATTISEAKSGETPLPNGRFHIHDPEEELALRFARSEDDADAYNALAAGFTVDGAFNVNSTSVEAWKAVLGSLRGLEIPVHDPLSNSISWEKSDLLFSRFAHPYDGPFRTAGDVDPDRYWRGYREISEEQLTELAEEIVRQVKLRGPFRSLGDFVNRSLEDLDPSDALKDDTRLSGPLQAALDRTSINRDIPSSLAQPVEAVPDSANEFHDVPEAATQGTGFPGYLLQGDILQALGPILTARSDTFRIRAYGDKVVTSRQDPSLEVVTARAWCEAIVQRLPEPVEKLREDSSPEEDLYQDAESIKSLYRDIDKPYFGRRFRVVSFRWLEKDEL